MCFLHLQNCRATPQNCLLVTCDISGLQGQGANRAKVTLPGYVDDRFFAVSLGMEVVHVHARTYLMTSQWNYPKLHVHVCT